MAGQRLFYVKTRKFRSNVELAFTPVKGLTLKAIGGYNYTGQQIRHYRSAMRLRAARSWDPSLLSGYHVQNGL